MNYEAYIPKALELVSAWESPPEDFAQVVDGAECETNVSQLSDSDL